MVNFFAQTLRTKQDVGFAAGLSRHTELTSLGLTKQFNRKRIPLDFCKIKAEISISLVNEKRYLYSSK